MLFGRCERLITELLLSLNRIIRAGKPSHDNTIEWMYHIESEYLNRYESDEYESIDEMLENINLKVYTISGQIIHQKNKINNKMYQFELNSPSGMYILEINESNKRQYYKLIK